MSMTESDTSTVNNVLIGTAYNDDTSRVRAAMDAASSLKRPASPEADDERNRRKRRKEDLENRANNPFEGHAPHAIDGDALADDLAQELQCGCCSGLLYKPVVVVPCDHFFCGSCCTMWVKNGGTNCPGCRGVSTVVMPSRTLQSMIDVLLRVAPHRQRTERERMQADEIYPVLRTFRIPIPREPSPEPVIPTSSDFLQPCPHCSPSNAFRWTCPRPIADPATNPDNAWRSDSGTAPGHGYCGNCEVLLALRAPSTTRCDFCQVSFCGINVQGRCVALDIAVQSPHGMADVADLIQSPEIYDCFEGNTAEVELMLDYMTAQSLTPKQIYRQIAAHIQSQPEGFRPLIEQDLFMDIHAVPAGTGANLNTPRQLICRLCAAEVFLYGLCDWWIRERQKAISEGILEDRKDCPGAVSCSHISDPAHAKEFNHIFSRAGVERVIEATTFSAESSSSSPSHPSDISTSAASTLFLPPIASDAPSAPPLFQDTPSLEPGLTIPHFPSMSNILPGSGLDPVEHSGDGQSSERASFSGVRDETLPRNVAAGGQGHEVISEAGAEDGEPAGPSSSQSQHSVQARLTENLLAEYDSDAVSEIESKERGTEDVDATARLGVRYAPEVAAQVGTTLLSRRHSRSPLKAGLDEEDSMDGVGAVSTSSFMSCILRDMGFEAAEAGAPPSSNAYRVQVE